MKKGRKKLDLVGQKFSRLTVIGEAECRGKLQQSFWLCKCDCGNETKVSTSNLNKKNTSSCGCLWREKISGSNCIWWKGGTTKPNDIIRRSPVHRQWTKAVKNKYNNTCQKCWKTKGRMCAHHLWSFHKYVDKRLDINNGICLCWDCHERYHYGRLVDDIDPITLFNFILK